MGQACLLGIDIGTSSCKVTLYDIQGNLIAQASGDYPVSRPSPLEAEQDPRDWWEAAKRAIIEVVNSPGVDKASIKGIGLSGQTPSQVLVDRQGNPVRPAIIWQDARATREAAWLRDKVGRERLQEFLGMDLPIEPTWTPARLLWLSRNEPGSLERAYKILQPKDYIGLKLTGEFFSDAWSSKGLVHLITGWPVREYLELVGVDAGHVPRCFRPFEVAGYTTRAAAEETSLPPGIPVVAGWSDALCGMLALKAFSGPARGFNLSGTSEIAGVSSSDTVSDPLGLVPVPRELTGEVAILYGPTQCGSDSLKWFMEAFGPSASLSPGGQLDSGRIAGGDAGAAGFHELIREGITGSTLTSNSSPSSSSSSALASTSGSNSALGSGLGSTTSPTPGPMIFLPYLRGERAPIWDPLAKGVFLGVTREHRKADFIRAVLEGVAFSVRHVLTTAEEASGVTAPSAALAGGGARNHEWNQLRADVLGRPVEVLEVVESGTLGAAILASVGAGIYESVRLATEGMVRIASVYEPSTSRRGKYDELFEVYKDTYRALKGLFPRLCR
ncbi:MAG TPA: hypothetical protein GXX51_10970 [Firmicutes bacterium]|nr:hypothetical protein [Bacillota bacterium]